MPPHLIDPELEDEFICALGWAAQRASDDTFPDQNAALDFFTRGLEIDLEDLLQPPARAVYRAIRDVIADGEVPAWAVLKNELKRSQPAVAHNYLPYVLSMGTGLISALPTYVERIKAIVAERTQYV